MQAMWLLLHHYSPYRMSLGLLRRHFHSDFTDPILMGEGKVGALAWTKITWSKMSFQCTQNLFWV